MNLRSLLPFVARRKPDHLYVPRGLVLGRSQRRDPADEASFAEAAALVRSHGRTLLGEDRLRVLWQAAHNSAHLGAAAAEVGSFRGGSAYFLAHAFRHFSGSEHEMRIFDTFEGHHPDHIDESKDTVHRAGMFRETSFEEVRAYLAPWSKLTVHKGDFETSMRTLPEMKFGFAHIDVDIYQTTLRCLSYFGARMPAGGVMVVDDYGAPKCPGVDEAVRDFLAKERSYQTWHFGTEQIVLVKV